MRLNVVPWLVGAAICASSLLLASTDAKAILGIDMGSLYMKVALVQRGAPLEIVTNLHSKRKTEQMILFDQGSRFYGADANSLLARKPTKTPAAMSVLLGRDDTHPNVKVCLLFFRVHVVDTSLLPYFATCARLLHIRCFNTDIMTLFFSLLTPVFATSYPCFSIDIN